jgi:DNA topoisomerase-1
MSIWDMYFMGILNKIDKERLSDLGIIYVDETYFTIKRKKSKDGYEYYLDNETKITLDKNIDRLNDIAVPPTYKDVLYSNVENGHILATGFDASGKKQYFYHDAWAYLREITKFSTLETFGRQLPSFRTLIQSNLKDTDSLDRETVLAAMARILDKTGMRVGNEQSAKERNTHGLTTLKKKHVDVDGTAVQFAYQGKGGMDLDRALSNEKVASVIENCAEIKGQRLFEFIDDNGEPQNIDSGDMNRFIQSSMGDEYSAKDFRTWRFSCYFMGELLRLSKKNEKSSLKSILQSSYIHPGLIELGKSNDWDFVTDLKPIDKTGLIQSEQIFMAYLKTKHAKQSFSKKD